MWRVLLTAGMSFYAVAVAATPATKSSQSRASETLVRTDEGRQTIDIKTPSLLSLLIHPELYDGSTIRVGGYMLYEYPAARLFISRDDRSALGTFFGTVKLSFHGAKIPLDYERLRKTAPLGYIVVQGRFSAGGPYGAVIDELQDYHFVLDETRGKNH